ncbi:hypothetical protein A1O1_04007 [Capronia coronata CBS 617.96]|uniref:Uncharacterized protein n=1 Tax=Capronia coronata CBS 617.96 TaxID=1182541 RepID=W9YNV8_9EURO|nr:uncharacterized protein A1O1_04007 [Capronia coronata CBS 617.96]EXJ90901.1 hypothetical protein A1O1_04007 [Capronia coronata CBS 617.96]
MSNSLQNFRVPWNHSASSFRGLPKSPTESTTPHYYDYSELFWDEESLQHPVGPPPAELPVNQDQPTSGNQPSPDRRHAQSPFGIMQGSRFQPAELPTTHNRRSSEQSKYSYGGVIPRRISSLAAATTPMRSNSTLQKDQAVDVAAVPLQEFSSKPSRGDKDHPRTSTASRRTCGSTQSSAFFPNASRSPRDLTSLAARVHSPVFDQRASDQSISQLLDYDDQHETENRQRSRGLDTPINSQWELPSFTFRPLSLVSDGAGARERPKTSGDVPPRDTLEILSPMPQRPMSSQSQKRFSRILELQDTYSAERTIPLFHGQTPSKLNVVEERPEIQDPQSVSLVELALEAAAEGPPEHMQQRQSVITHAHSDVNFGDSHITIHDKSTVESLLDRHIECLGLDEDGFSRFEMQSDSGRSDVAGCSSADSTIKISSIVKELQTQAKLRPATSSSYRHSSLASSERRRLMPRRLFASMDSRVSPVTTHEDLRGLLKGDLTSTATTDRQLSLGWHTLPSSSGLTSAQSATKTSLTSGDMGDIDSDPPQTKFKIRRLSDLGASLSEPSKGCPHGELPRQPQMFITHRRSKSDILARQASHQRRRMRIMLKTKRRSNSLGQLTKIISVEQGLQDHERDEDWTTEDSPEGLSPKSPVMGYAELSAESVIVHAPTTVLSASLPVSKSIPKRWTSMLASMPEPVKRGIDIVRKASVRTVRSHRSNVSVIEPMNSTRMSSQTPRLGPVPQLAHPEFGPPLMSSDLNLSLPFPEPPETARPQLRHVQSFFCDDSSVQTSKFQTKKRFDLHSLRSGLTRSSGVLGVKHGGEHHVNDLKMSHSCQMKGQRSFDCPQSPLGDTVPLTDCVYKKRKVMDRFKEWWKNQCMQKTLSMMRKKNSRNGRNGALV